MTTDTPTVGKIEYAPDYKSEKANIVQIVRCASGKHELSMLVNDCAYCKIEQLQADLAVARGEREGWKLVPKWPTPEMIDAGDRAEDKCYEQHSAECDAAPETVLCAIWHAMLAASPDRSTP